MSSTLAIRDLARLLHNASADERQAANAVLHQANRRARAPGELSDVNALSPK